MENKKILNNNFINHIIEQDLKKDNTLKIHTRFPPEPNGHLHIGHAKSIFLNFHIAQLYQGKCNLRFDDTNPNQENSEFIKSIKKDIQWLGFTWDHTVKFTSQYFDKLYQYAIKLIKKNLAYVDQLTKIQIKEYRGTLKKPGINSPFRSRSIEENILLFKQMKEGLIPEGQACLRAKINMSSPFIILRDPVLYRILHSKHHQTLNKWCIYPMYDFAHCIADSLEKITHSLCTLEFQDNRRLYHWILNNLNLKHRPYQYEFARLKLEYNILSKRKLKTLIDNKIVNNWNDPRMPTISGLRNRGYTPNSILQFCNKIGVTKKDSLIELSVLESSIRDDLNTKAMRIMAVITPIKVLIINCPDNFTHTIKVPNHPNQPQLGFRNILFTNQIYIDKSDFSETPHKKYNRLSIGKTVKLRYGYTITAIKVKKDSLNNIQYILCTYNPESLNIIPKNRKINGIIHWISEKNSMKAKFKLYDKLFNNKNPEIEENFIKHLNKHSLTIKKGFVEKSIIENKIATYFQFEREGYFYLENNTLQKNYLSFKRIVGLKKNLNIKTINS
ncbi:glutamine--tRNA ligase/YqeY domain fusion protein [Buchnera aphidicola (Hormaphis cornu)]|nr:glutamine--tRNA ligase/YqeY domain fusion protein [Buchnera aphidicola (Hormaphis cornu)]